MPAKLYRGEPARVLYESSSKAKAIAYLEKKQKATSCKLVTNRDHTRWYVIR